MQLLTHSRQDSFKSCRKKHWFAYEVGLRRTLPSPALRMGTAFHAALEQFGLGQLEAGMRAIREVYSPWAMQDTTGAWQFEMETVIAITAGYAAYWGSATEPLEHIATEQAFAIPLRNPSTGRASRIFRLAGKIDGIVRLEDGRLAVMEHKLLSEPIDCGARLWQRTMVDHQITTYVLAARELGFNVETVLYDVARKPTFSPGGTPVLDDDGQKIVYDEDGCRAKTKTGSWRQNGGAGYTVLMRDETPEEWSSRVMESILRQPEQYYQRREVPRLDSDLEAYREELWDIAQTMRDAQIHDRHYRTVSRDTCSWCPYFGPCTSGWSSSDATPDGFELLDFLHPELEELNGSDSTSTPAEATC